MSYKERAAINRPSRDGTAPIGNIVPLGGAPTLAAAGAAIVVLDANISEFKLGEQIGRGSHTFVRKVQKKGCKDVFAMKTGNKSDEKVEDHVKRETDPILLAIKHENVVQTLHVIDQPPEVHIVMEYMNMGSLAVLIELRSARNGARPEEGLFPENILSCIARQVVAGLLCLHQNKVIHRDLKPSNVLINSHGQVKVCDFGNSKIKTGPTTGTKIGSEDYMSRERVLGFLHNEKADIWSLGVTLAESELGVFPLTSPLEQPPDKLALCNRLKKGTAEVNFPLRIEQIRKLGTRRVPTLPSDRLRDFVELCMKLDPEERPSSEELQRHNFITTDPTLTTTIVFQVWIQEHDLKKKAQEISHGKRTTSASATTTSSSSSSSSSTSASEPTAMEE